MKNTLDLPPIYKSFSIVALAPGKKFPVADDWQLKKESDDIPPGWGIGIRHRYSRTVCFDIDNLKRFKKNHSKEWKLINLAPSYTSGKKNRLKILMRVPSGVKAKRVLTKAFHDQSGQIRCANELGGSVQDVLPPTRLSDGREYHWIIPLPDRFEDIPELPMSIYTDMHLGQKDKRRSGRAGRYLGKHLAPYVVGYNNWFKEKHMSLGKEILKTGGYYEVKYGYCRVGSASGSINIIMHEDENGEWGYNFSDMPPDKKGAKWIEQGAFDPYDLFVLNLSDVGEPFHKAEIRARAIVTQDKEISKYVDDEYRPNPGQAVHIGMEDPSEENQKKLAKKQWRNK